MSAWQDDPNLLSTAVEAVVRRNMDVPIELVHPRLQFVMVAGVIMGLDPRQSMCAECWAGLRRIGAVR